MSIEHETVAAKTIYEMGRRLDRPKDRSAELVYTAVSEYLATMIGSVAELQFGSG